MCSALPRSAHRCRSTSVPSLFSLLNLHVSRSFSCSQNISPCAMNLLARSGIFLFQGFTSVCHLCLHFSSRTSGRLLCSGLSGLASYLYQAFVCDTLLLSGVWRQLVSRTSGFLNSNPTKNFASITFSTRSLISKIQATTPIKQPSRQARGRCWAKALATVRSPSSIICPNHRLTLSLRHLQKNGGLSARCSSLYCLQRLLSFLFVPHAVLPQTSNAFSLLVLQYTLSRSLLHTLA